MSSSLSKGHIFDLLKKYGMVVVLVAMVILLSIAQPNFLSRTNILNVLAQASIFGIMALGLTFVIISKGIDLSVGSLLAFAGVISASLGQSAEAVNKYFPNLPVLPMIVPVLVALAIGAGSGAISGLFIARTKIPAFIATLGMMTITRGFALIYTSGRPISNLDPLSAFGGRLFDVVPVPILVYAVAIAVSWVLLNNTRFGKNVYAIGGNATAAEVSGINVGRNLIAIYAYSGLLAGLAAVVFAGRVGSMHPGAATGYELTAIAATTIGGTSHSGGIGTIWGAVVGALVLSVMRNGFTLLGVDAYWQQVTEGVIIITAVVIDMRKNAKKD